ncbi:Peptidase G2, IMC autoproteolytic cleavage domain containing protein [uncultured Caudovirales phage]|uniref:Peptidase G2, IMC autoproteolytic cleavage domain containing protein n=1 Tax=uncultured Caudovirales phage TaxID=2100421 RepID=A0A6J5M1Y2_9CAUD|nr:Peptidase G2, IMC autoproteolytic cleavage domain containing protein [uncultured Caudovirales phage]
MAYTINLTDGTIFATIADGTINTQSSMVLVGKNYAGYGEFLDENFIHLLENSSNTTAPSAPLEGQLWWDSGNSLLKVYNGSTFKTISAATASSTAPSNNVTGDLWYDTVNQQLKVWTGSAFLLVGPAFTAGTGTTGAIVDTIVDNTSVSHVVIKFFVEDDVVGIMSKDATFTPQAGISGFTTVRPGFQLATTVGSQTPLFQGTATDAQTLDGVDSTGFLSAISNDTTSGTLGILNDGGLSVGVDQDLRLSVVGTTATIANQTSNGNIAFSVNIGGTPTTVMNINGANGTISGNQINANYADVAERFEADVIDLPAGTVVELGGAKEITKVTAELSDNVFGVISTQAAYLMNSRAGTDSTHPPVAMTGRVPVKTVGTVRKGDRLVSAGNGLARAAKPGEATAFNVIGRALADKTSAEEGTVEAIVTIK